MGASESKRRVVVEDVNGEGVVQVTEAVVRRVKGMPDSPQKGSPTNSPQAARKSAQPQHNQHQASRDNHQYQAMSKEIEAFYNEKLDDLQKRSEALQQHSNEQFANAVKEVEQKFMKYTASPVCQDLQTKVLQCYQANPDSVLNCSPVINAFSLCVDRARLSVSQNRPQTNVQVQPVH